MRMRSSPAPVPSCIWTKAAGSTVIGIVNVVGSTIAREADGGIYLHAGPEIGVASTKAFTSQLVALLLFALYLGRQRGLALAAGRTLVRELERLPDLVGCTIALIDENTPVVFVAPKDPVYAKVVSNMQEVKARGGRVVAITSEGNGDLRRLADHQLSVPATLPLLSPVLTVIPLQLLAYHIAVLRGCDVDRPRNLAKSVTVE